MNGKHVSVPGSRRTAKGDAKRVRDLGPRSRVEVTVDLRHPELPEPRAGQSALSLDELASRYGAARHDADEVAKILRQYGLTTTEVSLATHSMRVAGTAAAMERAFRPHLGIYESASEGVFRGREDDYAVPASLAGIITGIHGFDQRRVGKRAAATKAGSALEPFGPADVERRYNFPKGDGSGQQIAIAEFGGGFSADDLAAYCGRFRRATPPVTVVPVGLDPLTPEQIAALPDAAARQLQSGYAVEVNLDVQIAAGLCPGAEIFMYFAPLTQNGWINLLDRVIGGRPARPVVLSISWGHPEDSPDWTPAARNAIDERLKSAALLGITVCVAAGDDGSGDGVPDGAAHVSFPSSSPYALSVGGTMLLKRAGAVVEETWNESPGQRPQGGATGGGTSAVFPRPAWQSAVGIRSINDGSTNGRAMPDVSALAGPPAYEVVIDGKSETKGGTSASTPLWAALIARMNALLPPGKQHRFLTPLLYSNAAGKALGSEGCRDIVNGNNTSKPSPNRGYVAAEGYDAVTGWGVPDGAALLEQLSTWGAPSRTRKPPSKRATASPRSSSAR